MTTPKPLPPAIPDHRAKSERHPPPARRRHMVGALVFTVALLGLIALSIEAVAGWLVVSVVATVAAVVFVFHRLFPGSRFFTVALANFIGIYACIFIFFVESNFLGIDTWVASVGFVLPLMAFLGGALRRRESIRAVVLREEREGIRFGRTFVWLMPVGMIGILTFVIPPSLPLSELSWVFIGSMAAIALIVFGASHDVAVMLLDSGLLFEEFWDQVAGLAEPAFAFFTFYSLLVIVFAALYTTIDRFSPAHHFAVHGQTRDITFGESLYFSVVTLSTVGYGDIVPQTDLVRVIVAGEVVTGVLLLLFGFNAIFTFATERRKARRTGHDRRDGGAQIG